MPRKVSVSAPYAPLYDVAVRNIIADTPRTSGKSFEMAQKVAVTKVAYPKHDIVVFRANNAEMTKFASTTARLIQASDAVKKSAYAQENWGAD